MEGWTGMLTSLQLWHGVCSSQLYLPSHSHRPPPQLFRLQHFTAHQVCCGLFFRTGRRISGFLPSTFPFGGCYSSVVGKEGFGEYHVGSDFCICHVQQGLHKSGVFWFSEASFLSLLLTDVMIVLFVVYGLLAILPSKLILGSKAEARFLCSCPLGHRTSTCIPLSCLMYPMTDDSL